MKIKDRGWKTSAIGKYMKILKFVFFVFLAFSLVVSASILIFLQVFNFDKYLPQITKKASNVLSRQVKIGHLGLGFSWHGLSLDAGPVAVVDDANFTNQPVVEINKVCVFIDLKSLVFQHGIHIEEIVLEYPRLHLIRSYDGNLNIRSFGQSNQMPIRSIVVPVITRETKQAPAGRIRGEIKTNDFFDNIKTIEFHDAAISYIDQNPDMPLDFWLRDFNVEVNRLSLSNPLKGSIMVTGVLIKDYNIVKIILSHLPVVIGGMGNYIDQVSSRDTIINKAELDFSMRNQSFMIENLLLKTNILEFTASGSVNPGLDVDLQTILHLNQGVTAMILKQFEGLKYLCDDQNRITIQAGLNGIYPDLKYKPNKEFRKKSKKAFNAMFRQLFRA